MAFPAAVEHISNHILGCLKETTEKPVFVALQGPQGSGKSYLTDLVRSQLSASPQSLNVVVLSIDDLYLPHEGLQELSRKHPDNPLWRGRGQPGTHDVDLGHSILKSLKQGTGDVELPRFDKSLFDGEGDRLPMDGSGVVVRTPVDVVIMEGWFVGFYPITQPELQRRWEGVWVQEKSNLNMDDAVIGTKENISAVNDALFKYMDLWSLFEIFIQLQPAPTQDSKSPYSVIYKWRLEQEHYMKARNGGKGMNDSAVKLFVDRYIPGYVFFGDGVTEGYAASDTAATADSSPGNITTPPWLGRALRIVIDESREVVGIERF